MRSLRRMKEKNIIESLGVTSAGVVKYRLPCISSDTCTDSDTGVNTDTCTDSDTSPRLNLDTPPVSVLIPKAEKETEKENNLLIASTADEKIFSLLWEKWNQDSLCLWESIDSLREYISMRDLVLAYWKNQNLNKELVFELQMIDIFLMEQKLSITEGKEYSGSPRLWARRNWIGGIRKWLQSSTPSRLSEKRKRFIPYCIKLSVDSNESQDSGPVEQQPQHNKEESYQEHIKELEALYELLYDCEDLREESGYLAMRELFVSHYQTTPFPDSLRDDDRFYEYFYNVDTYGGNNE